MSRFASRATPRLTKLPVCALSAQSTRPWQGSGSVRRCFSCFALLLFLHCSGYCGPTICKFSAGCWRCWPLVCGLIHRTGGRVRLGTNTHTGKSWARNPARTVLTSWRRTSGSPANEIGELNFYQPGKPHTTSPIRIRAVFISRICPVFIFVFCSPLWFRFDACSELRLRGCVVS
jgi:hypothetical protein